MILEVKNLYKSFMRGRVQALSDVSLSVSSGKTIGILGESGSGKSTLAKIIMRLLPCDKGEIYFNGQRIDQLKERNLKDFRKKVQIIFQDPFGSFNPKIHVGESLIEPLRIQRAGDKETIEKKANLLLELVGLPQSFKNRLPLELSGGECQRLAIARGLSLDPELLICDEPISSLDAFTGAQILNLLLKIQKERAITIIFITHDVAVARHMSDEIIVMKDGSICEWGGRDEIFKNPKHTYTQSLIQTL